MVFCVADNVGHIQPRNLHNRMSHRQPMLSYLTHLLKKFHKFSANTGSISQNVDGGELGDGEC